MRIFLLMFLMACSSNLTLEGRQLWASKNLQAYRYTLQSSCFCPEEYTKAMLLEVHAGVLTSIKYVDSGEVVPENFRPRAVTIEAFFDLIDTTQAKGGKVDRLQFDPSFGYPTQFFLDPILNAIDDESSYTLANLQAL